MHPARLVLVGLVLLAAAGCADDGSSDATPPTASSSSTITTTPSATDGTGSSTETADLPFPGVAPADGPQLKQTSATIHAPRGWTRAPSTLGIDSGAGRGSYDLINLVDQDEIGSFPDSTTDELAKIVLRGNRQMGGTYRRAEDVVVDGVAMARITGVDSYGLVEEKFTASRDGRLVSLTIKLTQEGARKEPDLVASVLNSWTWH